MAVTARRSFLALVGVAAWADERAEINAVLSEMASALANGLAGAFLKPFDRAMPGYEDLRGEVEGLLAAAEVSASVELRGVAEGKAQVDWYLQIKSRRDGLATRQKRELLNVGLEKRGKRWVITSLEPRGFFSDSR